MRIPWRVIKTRGIWILISAAGFFTFVLNFLRLTAPYTVDVRLSKAQLLHQLQPIKVKEEAILAFKASEKSTSHPTQPPYHPEVTHIAFLKVHKAASSTAQNIFMRFGWNRNLTFVLPPSKNPSGYPNIISLRESLTNSNILPPPPNKSYDILCNHVFYTKEAFSKFMPKDSAFIGILREPFELYKSILNYFRPRYIFAKINGANPASEFLRNPSKYEPKGRISGSWTNSRMAVELGFPPEVFKVYNQTTVDAYIKKLDGEFKVMLIADNMEESVIIMRRYLHWNTEDIVYISQNIARKKNETMLSKAFDRDFYKKYAKIDYTLYNYFYKRLRNQIRHEGADFDDELLAFKELRKNLGEYCSQQEVQTPINIPETRWGKAFQVTKAKCAEMRLGEQQFVAKIRIRQYGSKDI